MTDLGGNSGSRASTEPVPVSALTGFDPGRITEEMMFAGMRAMEECGSRWCDDELRAAYIAMREIEERNK